MAYEPPITIHDGEKDSFQQVHKIMADIFKPADSPEFPDDGDRKIVEATVTLPLNREEL